MQIHCRQCGAEIPAGNINLDRMVAKCRACNAVFSFADQLDNGANYWGDAKLDVSLPKNLAVDNFGSELKITRRWFSPKYIAMIFFSLFWNGFMVVWYGIAIANQIWIMALFGLLHAGVGIWLIYYILCGFVNITEVKVSPNALTVKHSPIPYPGNKRLDPFNIDQLYSKEKISRNRNSTTYSYEVHLITREGKHQKLVTGLDEPEQALYMEQKIEQALNITDRRVRGELGR